MFYGKHEQLTLKFTQKDSLKSMVLIVIDYEWIFT